MLTTHLSPVDRLPSHNVDGRILYQIGYREPTRMLAGSGPAITGTVRPIPVGARVMVKPESVNTPGAYGVTYSQRHAGGTSWCVTELFSHVKTPGWHGVEVI